MGSGTLWAFANSLQINAWVLSPRDKGLSLGLGRAGGEIGDDCIKLGFPKDSPEERRNSTKPKVCEDTV